MGTIDNAYTSGHPYQQDDNIPLRRNYEAATQEYVQNLVKEPLQMNEVKLPQFQINTTIISRVKNLNKRIVKGMKTRITLWIVCKLFLKVPASNLNTCCFENFVQTLD